MKYRNDGDKIFVSLAPGDEIVNSITSVAHQERLGSGWVLGIGAMENLLVGYYNVPKQEYLEREYPGEYELLSLSGNISLKDGDPFFHPHITFSGEDFQVFGGHLFNGTISAAGEFVILTGQKAIPRRFNEQVGLALWSLES